MNNKITLIILVALALSLGNTTVFFSSSILTHGDWYYFFGESREDILSLSNVWETTQGFGHVNWYGLVHSPIFIAWGLLAKFFDYSIIERLLYIFPIIIVSIIGSFYLARSILNSNVASIISVIVYNFNVYILLSRTGHLTISMAYAFAPFILYMYIKVLKKRSYKHAIILGFLFFLAGSYEFRIFYILLWVMLFYFIFYMVFVERPKTLKELFSFSFLAALPVLLVFLLFSYWLLPFGNMNALEQSNVLGRPLFGKQFMSILWSMSLFHTYWTSEGLTYFEINPTPIHFLAIPLAAFTGFALSRKSKEVLFFAFIGLLGIFLTKQNNIPFSEVYGWLYRHLPGFSAFREASKFYILIALSYAILIGALIDWLWKNWNQHPWKIIGKYAITMGLAGIFLWNAKPLLTGEIGTLFVERKIPKDYITLKKFLKEDREFYRTLWVPQFSRWGFFDNQRPWTSLVSLLQPGGAGLMAGHWKNLSNNGGNPSQGMDKNIWDLINNHAFDALIDISSFKYIILPLRDVENDNDFYIYYGSGGYRYYKNLLDTAKNLKKLDIGTKEVMIYENEGYKPHIYGTKSTESIYFNQSFKKMDYEFVSPSEYRVKIKNISHNFFLNFSEKYHPDWRVSIGPFSWFQSLIGSKGFLSKTLHSRNDANLNSFFIDINQIKSKYPNSYETNSDGSINLELTLFFEPQSMLYIGAILSLTTFFISIWYLLSRILTQKKFVHHAA